MHSYKTRGDWDFVAKDKTNTTKKESEVWDKLTWTSSSVKKQRTFGCHHRWGAASDHRVYRNLGDPENYLLFTNVVTPQCQWCLYVPNQGPLVFPRSFCLPPILSLFFFCSFFRDDHHSVQDPLPSRLPVWLARAAGVHFHRVRRAKFRAKIFWSFWNILSEEKERHTLSFNKSFLADFESWGRFFFFFCIKRALYLIKLN